MIPYDVVYYRPRDPGRGAARPSRRPTRTGWTRRLLGGGTEIVTMARDGEAASGALVDLKGVPECRGESRSAGGSCASAPA